MTAPSTSTSTKPHASRLWYLLFPAAAVFWYCMFMISALRQVSSPGSSPQNNLRNGSSNTATLSSSTSLVVPPDRRLECKKFRHMELPIPSAESWRIMREAYLQAKDTGRDPSWDEPRMSNYKSGNGGLKVPFEARQSPGKGRGLFATEFIPKGTVVFKNDLTGRFRNGAEWREFLYRLSDSSACDVLTWAYPTLRDEKDGKSSTVIEIDLNEGALMNSGNTVGYKESDMNTIYALRDLQPGDEIMVSYSSFVGSSPKWKSETSAAKDEGGLWFRWELSVHEAS